jgi:hypothetical protein
MKIAHQILKEIVARLKFLQDVGLNYLTLDRSADTLSGGEAQRIRLATQIGSGLTGVLYILDEPSIGLAPARQRPAAQDSQKLARPGQHCHCRGARPRNYRSLGLGHRHRAGAGKHGGELVAEGTPKPRFPKTKIRYWQISVWCRINSRLQPPAGGGAPRPSRSLEPQNTTSKMSISKFLWVNLSV